MPQDMENLDEVVEIITRRVAEKLQQMGFLTGQSSTSSCVIDGQECSDCGHCATKRPEAVRNILNSGADRIGAKIGINGSKINRELAGTIDHTLLKPDASREQLIKVCRCARNRYGNQYRRFKI
jgi:ferredoxin